MTPEMTELPFKEVNGKIRLQVHLQPGAKRESFAGLYGNSIKIAVNAPPVDGKANAAVTKFIAKSLGLPARQVELVSGQTSREKVFMLTSSELPEIIAKLKEFAK